jgi:hypothetical protein
MRGADRPTRFVQSLLRPVCTERFHDVLHDRIGRVGVVVSKRWRLIEYLLRRTGMGVQGRHYMQPPASHAEQACGIHSRASTAGGDRGGARLGSLRAEEGRYAMSGSEVGAAFRSCY